MLLLWLLLLPTAHATIECHSACGLCALDRNPETAACALCRECHKVHARTAGPKNLMISKQQKILKNMARIDFKKVMKEYGRTPVDLVDSDSKLDKVNDDNDCLPPPSECINEDSWENYKPPTKPDNSTNNEETKDTKKLTNTKRTEYPAFPATPKTCPNKPCKKMALVEVNKRKLKDEPTYSSTKLTIPVMILKHIVTFEAGDQGCPTQPTTSGPEDDEDPLYEELAPPPPTKPNCPEKLVKKLIKTSTNLPTTSCVPCMPACPLPCGSLVAQNPQILPSIPSEALAALMTLRPTTIDDQPISTQAVEEKIEKLLHKKVFIEDTTKDYVYLYVGIPKEHGRYE